jgi:hypothetical protein
MVTRLRPIFRRSLYDLPILLGLATMIFMSTIAAGYFFYNLASLKQKALFYDIAKLELKGKEVVQAREKMKNAPLERVLSALSQMTFLEEEAALFSEIAKREEQRGYRPVEERIASLTGLGNKMSFQKGSKGRYLMEKGVHATLPDVWKVLGTIDQTRVSTFHMVKDGSDYLLTLEITEEGSQ